MREAERKFPAQNDIFVNQLSISITHVVSFASRLSSYIGQGGPDSRLTGVHPGPARRRLFGFQTILNPARCDRLPLFTRPLLASQAHFQTLSRRLPSLIRPMTFPEHITNVCRTFLHSEKSSLKFLKKNYIKHSSESELANFISDCRL